MHTVYSGKSLVLLQAVISEFIAKSKLSIAGCATPTSKKNKRKGGRREERIKIMEVIKMERNKNRVVSSAFCNRLLKFRGLGGLNVNLVVNFYNWIFHNWSTLSFPLVPHTVL